MQTKLIGIQILNPSKIKYQQDPQEAQSKREQITRKKPSTKINFVLNKIKDYKTNKLHK